MSPSVLLLKGFHFGTKMRKQKGSGSELLRKRLLEKGLKHLK
jgi:hypothetical protein